MTDIQGYGYFGHESYQKCSEANTGSQLAQDLGANQTSVDTLSRLSLIIKCGTDQASEMTKILFV